MTMTTREEQDRFLSEEYAEANRYMDNAKEVLRKAGKDGNNYTDKKYVKMASGTAYNGVLIALDAWFVLKGIPTPSGDKRKSIKFYMSSIAQMDRKLAATMDDVYNILHLSGYYDGITNVKVIAEGFELAHNIIEKIKPEHFVPVKETRAQGIKRGLNNLLVSIAVMFK
jgi:hypothetical protein